MSEDARIKATAEMVSGHMTSACCYFMTLIPN